MARAQFSKKAAAKQLTEMWRTAARAQRESTAVLHSLYRASVRAQRKAAK